MARSLSMRETERTSKKLSVVSGPAQIFTSTSSRMWRQSVVSSICFNQRFNSAFGVPIT